MSINVPTGIIDLFLHPPLGTMTKELVPGEPFTGLFSLTRPRGLVNVDAFGLRWFILSSPPGYGITPGAGVNTFDRVVIELQVVHELGDGELVTSQGGSFRASDGLFLFEQSFPHNVSIQLAPGVTARFWWLLVF